MSKYVLKTKELAPYSRHSSLIYTIKFSKTTLIMEYVIDNEHFADHLTPPSSTPPVFFNLTQYIDEETLSTLDSYLLSNDILHFAEKQKE